MKRTRLTLSLLAGMLLLGPLGAFAQDAAPAANIQNQLLMLLVFTMIVIALVTLMLTITVFYLIRQQRAAAATATESPGAETPAVAQPDFWTRFWLKINAFRPIEKEKDLDLGHDYDGIRELDNSLPPWWKYGFYLTIFLGVIYMYHYHLSGSGWSSAKEYQEEMAEAERQKAEYLKTAGDLVDETSATLLTDAASLASGKEIYTANCVACHGVEGQGGVGPNFADEYWIHGGSVKDLFKVIKYGVPEKGMISWQSQLNPRKMQEVASYILTFQGTTPPNPKEPQGELYVPQEEAAPADSAATDSASLAVVVR